MKHDNRSFACCFYIEFWHENTKPNVRRVYVQRLTVGGEVCRSFGRQKHVARHRSYRLVLGLRSRYGQKTKNRSPSKNYRYNLVLPPPPKSLPPKNEKPSTAEELPPYGIAAEILPPYFAFTASANVVTAKKRKNAYCRKFYAVWHYRPACVRLKKRYRL